MAKTNVENMDTRIEETNVSRVSEKPALRSPMGPLFRCSETNRDGLCGSTYNDREVMIRHLRRVHRKVEREASEIAAACLVQ